MHMYTEHIAYRSADLDTHEEAQLIPRRGFLSACAYCKISKKLLDALKYRHQINNKWMGKGLSINYTVCMHTVHAQSRRLATNSAQKNIGASA